MPWGKKWPVQMNLPFFVVITYVPGGVQNQAEKNSKKCLLAGTGTKIYFSSIFHRKGHRNRNRIVTAKEIRLQAISYK